MTEAYCEPTLYLGSDEEASSSSIIRTPEPKDAEDGFLTLKEKFKLSNTTDVLQYKLDDDDIAFMQGIIASYQAQRGSGPQNYSLHDSSIETYRPLSVSSEASPEPKKKPLTKHKLQTRPKIVDSLTVKRMRRRHERTTSFDVVIQDKTARNWNEELQTFLDRWKSVNFQKSQVLKLATSIRLLVEEFTNVATAEGKIIIDELFTNDDNKTIEPVGAGGVAGGVKYVSKGIFFKVATDVFKLYGGDEYAMKVAYRELDGLRAISGLVMNKLLENLHFPLMVIICYKGYCLLASSVLPIDASTLVYGSDDAGKTVHADDRKVNRLMQEAGKLLNLKPHVVSDKTIYMPGDIEVHKGKDERFYILDTARVFPPVKTDKSIKGGHLYRLFRPELVRKFHKSLSSDAYSVFGTHNAEEHNKEVREATKFLNKVVCADFVKDLPKKLSLSFPYTKQQYADFYITLRLYGINVRCLGTLFNMFTNDQYSNFVLITIVARVLKNEIRRKLRFLQTSNEVKVKEGVMKCLKLFFGVSRNTDVFWRVKLPKLINKHFNTTLDQDDLTPLHDPDMRRVLFEHTNHLSKQTVKVPKGFFKDESRSFSHVTVQSIEVKVKRLNIFSFIEGFACVEMAKSKFGVEAEKLYKMGIEKYAASIIRAPGDSVSFTNYGIALYQLGEMELRRSNAKRAIELLKQADAQFEIATSLRPQFETFFNWAQLYKVWAQAIAPNPVEQRKKLDHAISLRERGEEIAMTRPNYIDLAKDHETLGLILKERALCETDSKKRTSIFKRAQMKFEKAVTLKESFTSYVGSGIAFYQQADLEEDVKLASELYEKAYKRFETASKHSKIPSIWFNWGLAYNSQAARVSDAVEQDRLLQQAYDKFVQAAKNDNTYYHAYCYAAAAMKQIALKRPKECVSMLQTACTLAKKSVALSPTFGPGIGQCAAINLLLGQHIKEPKEKKKCLLESIQGAKKMAATATGTAKYSWQKNIADAYMELVQIGGSTWKETEDAYAEALALTYKKPLTSLKVKASSKIVKYLLANEGSIINEALSILVCLSKFKPYIVKIIDEGVLDVLIDQNVLGPSQPDVIRLQGVKLAIACVSAAPTNKDVLKKAPGLLLSSLKPPYSDDATRLVVKQLASLSQAKEFLNTLSTKPDIAKTLLALIKESKDNSVVYYASYMLTQLSNFPQIREKLESLNVVDTMKRTLLEVKDPNICLLSIQVLYLLFSCSLSSRKALIKAGLQKVLEGFLNVKNQKNDAVTYAKKMLEALKTFK